MNRVIRVFFLTLLFSLALAPLAWAEVLLEDDFDGTGKVDLSRTTAYVDTANSLVRLPKQTMPNSVAMLKYGEGYAVVTTTGVVIAEYDDATGSLHDTTIPWLADARGLAIRQDDMGLWVIGDDYVQFCSFAGGAYPDDPALKASGMSEILSVGAVEGTDQGVVLSKSNGKARITRYRAGASLAVELDMELDIDEPTALAVVDGTPDLVVLTKTGQHYLMFDDATGGYAKDPARSASGLTFASSVGANSDGTAILDNSEGRYLIYDDAGGMQQVLCYSTGPVPGAVAISLKPGAYDQAFVTEDGEVQYYIYDDSAGGMTRLSEMERTGLQLAGGYQHPKEYYSKSITTVETYNTIRLTSDQEVPETTTVKWYLSTDGGLTWSEVTLGQWFAISLANNFIVHATLDTTDITVTPIINEVILEASKLGIANLRLTAITYPPGAASEPILEPPITVFPINIHAGSKVQFQVDTTGIVDQVVALFSDGQLAILEPSNLSIGECNTWSGEYSLSPELTDGMSVAVTFTATDIWGRKAYLVQNPFLIIEGNIASFSKVILTE